MRKIHRRISQQARFGEAAGACVSQPDSWCWPTEVTPDRRVGTFPPGVHRWSDQAVASTSSSLHSSTRRAFWTQTLVMFHICTDVHFDSHMSLRLPIVDTIVLGDLTKPSITIASVDRFYSNLVNCLQLRHCIIGPEFCWNPTSFAGVMTMYTGGYFFLEHSVVCQEYVNVTEDILSVYLYSKKCSQLWCLRYLEYFRQ